MSKGFLGVDLAIDIKPFQQGLNRATNSLNGFASATNARMGAVRNAFTATIAVTRGLQVALAAMATLAAGSLIGLADNMRLLENRTKLAAQAAGATGKEFGTLVNIAKGTSTKLEDTVALFQKLSIPAPELKLTNDQILLVTKTIQELGVVGGASAEDMKNGIHQFGQAMTGAKVQMEDFGNVQDSLPLLVDTVAKSMGMSFGQFMKKVRDGGIESRQVMEALLKESKNVEAQFQKMGGTLSTTVNAGTIGFNQWISGLDKVMGVSKDTQGALAWFGKWFGWLGTAIGATVNFIYKAFKSVFYQLKATVYAMGFLIQGLIGGTLKGIKLIVDKLAKIKVVQQIGGGLSKLTGGAIDMPSFALSTFVGDLGNELWGAGKNSWKQVGKNFKIGDAAWNEAFTYNPPEMPSMSLSNVSTKVLGKGGASAGKGGKSEAQKAAEKAQAEAKRVLEALKEQAKSLSESLRTPMEVYKANIAEIDMLLGKGLITQETYNRALAKYKTELEESDKVMQDHKAKAKEVFESTRTDLEKYNAELKELQELLKLGLINEDTFKRANDKAKESLNELKTSGEKMMAGIKDSIDGWARNISTAISDFVTTGKMDIKDLFRTIIGEILRMYIQLVIIEPMVKRLKDSLTGGSSGGSAKGGILATAGKALLGGLKIPGFATGGLPPVGMPSIVGERGPELIVPTQQMRVFNNRDTNALLGQGGGTTYVTNYYVDAIDFQSFNDHLKQHKSTIGGIALESQQRYNTRRGVA